MSVITYLQSRASNAVLSTMEKRTIDTSIATIKTRLEAYFGTGLSSQLRFGSSTRDTILPRSMDEHSDIDYLVVFSESGYAPQTYLDRLKRFAEKYYASSEIKQSSPSIVLQLNHIKFDLVPALKQEWWSSSYRIPNGPSAWQDTDPNEFNKTLNEKNAAELYMVKPAIRLVKFWNADRGYIYDSYGLEKYIVGQSFYGVNNIREYVFTSIDSLTLRYDQPQYRKDRLARAKEIIAEVRNLEKEGYPNLAETEVKKLIPA